MKTLSDYWDLGYTFNRYLENFETEYETVSEDDPMYGYIRLNWSRTRRLLKQTTLLHPFGDLELTRLKAIAITEHWCGDAAQNLPVIDKIFNACGIHMRLVYRDQNPELMDGYLTRGTRSIPKVIVFDPGREMWVWGPRPAPVQELMYALKENSTLTKEEKSIEIQKWYNSDGSKTLQSEFFTALSSL